MDIRSLELFLSLSETLHYGRTSDLMHVSPSALTRHIQRLEDDLGVRLLARDNRTVTLTVAGKNAKVRFQAIIREWRQLKAEINTKNQLTGTLHLYCSVTAAYTVMKTVIEKFRPAFPEVKLSITTGDSALAVSKVNEGEALPP
jgi:LysR family transcriptional regulator, positive regulator for ilvC